MLTKPGVLLHVEGGAILALSLIFFQSSNGSWGLFALLFLAPDLFMLGYLANSRAGAALYNFAHTLTMPSFLLAAGSFAARPSAVQFALIWAAHIGFDRLLGYGLKYPTHFKDSHLQRVR
jgi:hypothetical protein